MYNLQFPERFQFIKDIFYADTRKYEGNVDIETINRVSEADICALVSFVFIEFVRLCKIHKSRLLFVIDTDRQAIYIGNNPKKSKIYMYNTISIQTAKNLNIPIIDLTESFVEDFKKHKKRFEFNIDGHWNIRAHQIVGRQIATWIVTNCFNK
jgi:hypothetical protein